MLLDYTTPEEIRAVLGVDEVDIADATLALPIYESYLTMELEDIDVTLPDLFATTSALPTPTAAETRFLTIAKMFATFALAKHLTGSLPLFALKQESDGKAQASRFDNPYRDVINSVNREYDRVKSKLLNAMQAISAPTTTSTPRVYFSTVALSTDPITNA